MEVERGNERAGEKAGESFGQGSFPSLSATLPVRAQPGELQPEAAVSHKERFHSCTGPELCVIQKLSKTMALRKISFSVSVLLSITVLCRNTAAGNPGEGKEKKAGAMQQVLVEVACGVPAFKKPGTPLSDSSGASDSQYQTNTSILAQLSTPQTLRAAARGKQKWP